MDAAARGRRPSGRWVVMRRQCVHWALSEESERASGRILSVSSTRQAALVATIALGRPDRRIAL
jgi:hypothetical protein